MEAEFPPDTDKRFYESDDFQLLMTAISRGKGKHSGLKQDGTSLLFFHSFPPDSDQASLMAEAQRVLTELYHSRESLRTPLSAEK